MGDGDEGRVRVHFTRVHALVPLICVLDEQLPVVGWLVLQHVSGVTAVRVLAERDQVQFLAFAPHPGHLHQREGRISRGVEDAVQGILPRLSAHTHTVFPRRSLTRQCR